MRAPRFILLSLIALAGAFAMAAETRTWESVERLPSQAMEQMAQQDDIAVAVADGYVYVALRQRATIGLFTILGQPLVHDTLQPGYYRFRLLRRGIYLLKAGSITRRVTI